MVEPDTTSSYPDDPKPRVPPVCGCPASLMRGGALASAGSRRKDRLLHLFPAPGISEDDISKCSAYGRIVADALSSSAVANIQEQLNRSLARQVVPHLLFQEKSAAKAFAIWSRVIRSRGGPGDPRRKPAVLMFGCWLASVLVLFTPLSFLIFYLALPFRRSAVDRQIRQVYTQ